MATKVEKKENGLIVLNLEVSAEDFRSALQKAYKANARRFQVPGFRKGKVPYALAMRHYGEAVLYDDAIDFALAEPYKEAVEQGDWVAYDRPDLDVQEIGSESGLKAVLSIPVYPDVELGQYLGVEVEREEPQVTDEEVQAQLQRIQERNGRMVPVEDRAAEEGDTARIDFEGFLGDEPFEGGKGEGHDLVLGSHSFIPGFEEQVVGHRPGESFDIQVTFPEDYHAAELAGKETRFAVTLHSLKKKELPELDDEFAKDVSEFDTLDEYRADQKAKLEEQAQKRAEQAFEQAVVARVVELSSVELPERMVEKEITQALAEQERRMNQQGIQLNQYLQYIGKTLEEMRKEMRPSAEQSLKTMLVLQAVVKDLNLEVTDELYQEECAKIAEQYHLSVDEVKERLGRTAELERMLLQEQAQKRLVAEAKPIAPEKSKSKSKSKSKKKE